MPRWIDAVERRCRRRRASPPSPSSAPACAAASMPNARPETIVTPAAAECRGKRARDYRCPAASRCDCRRSRATGWFRRSRRPTWKQDRRRIGDVEQCADSQDRPTRPARCPERRATRASRRSGGPVDRCQQPVDRRGGNQCAKLLPARRGAPRKVAAQCARAARPARVAATPFVPACAIERVDAPRSQPFAPAIRCSVGPRRCGPAGRWGW